MQKRKFIFYLFVIIILFFIIFQTIFQKKYFEKIKESKEVETINGQICHIDYVDKDYIYPAYGYSKGNKIVIRKDLAPVIKNFVKSHELYHCQDKSQFGGWIGREIRANIIPGFKNPIGFVCTALKTITDLDRIKFYLERFKRGG